MSHIVWAINNCVIFHAIEAVQLRQLCDRCELSSNTRAYPNQPKISLQSKISFGGLLISSINYVLLNIYNSGLREDIEQGWPTFCTLRDTFRYLKKSAGLTYPSAPNMFNIQYIKLWQGEQTFIVL